MTQSTRNLDCSIYRYVADALADKSDAPLLQLGDTCLDAAFVMREIAKYAAFLHEAGVRAGDVVTLCSPNIPVAVVALYAVNYLGAIVSVAHPFTPPRALADYMRKTRSSRLLCWDALVPKAGKLWRDFEVIGLSADTYLRPIDRIKLIPVLGVAGRAKCLRYDPRRPYPALAPVEREGETAAMYLPSGGTTGVPKTIVVSNAMLNASAYATVRLSYPLRPEEDAMLMVLPIFHGFGVGACMHSAFSTGVRLVLEPRFVAKRVAKTLRRASVTYMAGVPTLYRKLLSVGTFDQRLSLKCAYCGGDVLAPSLKQSFDDAMRRQGSDCRLLQGYGLTETVAVCCANTPTADCAGSIGRPAWGTEMCVRNDQGEVSDGETGELCVAGELVMAGYLDATPPDVLQRHDGKVWLHTGDLGYRQDGFFYFAGRNKRLTVIAGVNVYHRELEELAETLPSVRQAAAVEMNVGGKPYVRLVLAVSGDRAQISASLRALFASALTRYEIPREILFVTQIPLTSLGKVDYAALQRLPK